MLAMGPSQIEHTGVCLGPQTHATPEEFICHVCGALVAGATLLDTYQVRQRLGRGRSGEAYLVEHLPTEQVAVAKLFGPERESPPRWEDARREVRIMNSLRHPGIVPVYICTPIDLPRRARIGPPGTRYLLTLCSYAPLSLASAFTQVEDQVQAGRADEQMPIRLRTLHTYLSQLTEVLKAAHAHQVVHAALTPGNLLLKSPGHLWVADFGLARLHPPTGVILPPELQGVPPDQQWDLASPATDQYMLATLCQEVFSRLLPAHTTPIWNALLRRALHPNPQHRYESLDYLMQPLLEWLALFEQNNPQGKLPGSPLTSSPGAFQPLAQVDGATTTGRVNPPGRGADNSRDSGALLTLERSAERAFLQGDFEEAAKLYYQAIQVSQGQDAALWSALGDAYVALQRYDRAWEAYEQALMGNPGDAQTWENRGVALDALGRTREAADSYERARQLKAEGNR